MTRKRDIGAGIGFSNERFLSLLATVTGISPVGVLGRETPLDFSSLEAARGSLLLREVFSKYDDGKPSPIKEETTWKRFHEAERLCLETNQIVPKTFKYDPFWVCVRRRIWELLGTFSWDECAKFFGHGPGGTTRLRRSESYAAYKYSGKPESTSGNAALASCAIRMNSLWKHNVLSRGGTPDDLVTVIPGNSVITVPKNFKTDRTIAKEPCMNVYIQKGIGSVIRRKLKSVGVDLNDQRNNQNAARLGSIDGSLATVDLSMASDTVSFSLVEFLLPNDWWWALEQCRSPVGVLTDGTVIRYQKFSSMGNGYTFELESLIFWAIAQQVCCTNIWERDNSVLVYGDDLVIRSTKCPELLRRLWQAGFTPNAGKTFFEGPYRESCGKHYFLGAEITPFYVRRPVRSLDRLFLVHNNLRRWLRRSELSNTEALTSLRGLAPAKWREPRLPDGFGDGAFIGAVDELKLLPSKRGWEGWTVKALSRSQTELCDDLPEGQLVASLLAAESGHVPDFYRREGLNKPECRKLGLLDMVGGLAAKPGGYKEINIFVPRYAQVILDEEDNGESRLILEE
jgi:hypothetical protein